MDIKEEMTDSQIEKSIEKRYLQLSGFEWIFHFSLSLLFIFPSLYLLFETTVDLIKFQRHIYADQQEKLMILLGFLIVGVLLYWIQKRRLIFKVVTIQSLNKKEIYSIID